jgi:hypothetical protein
MIVQAGRDRGVWLACAMPPRDCECMHTVRGQVVVRYPNIKRRPESPIQEEALLPSLYQFVSTSTAVRQTGSDATWVLHWPRRYDSLYLLSYNIRLGHVHKLETADGHPVLARC